MIQTVNPRVSGERQGRSLRNLHQEAAPVGFSGQDLRGTHRLAEHRIEPLEGAVGCMT